VTARQTLEDNLFIAVRDAGESVTIRTAGRRELVTMLGARASTRGA